MNKTSTAILLLLLFLCPIIGWCQLSYEALPDTIFQIYEYEMVSEQFIPYDQQIEYLEAMPATFKTVPKNIETKTFYRNCNNCEYEEYIDSIETRPAYQKIIPYRKISFDGYRTEIKRQEEWAWVKRFNTIPDNHQSCPDQQLIDTCLWNYVVIKAAVIDTFEVKEHYHLLDTVLVPAKFIPIKKYRLKKEHADANMERYPKGKESCTIRIHQLEQKEKIRSIQMGTYKTRQRRVLRLFEKVTPLSYAKKNGD